MHVHAAVDNQPYNLRFWVHFWLARKIEGGGTGRRVNEAQQLRCAGVARPASRVVA